jgi:hypothetical protein
MMNISVNLVSGEVYTFDVPVERPIEFLGKIRPTEVFQRPVHQFIGKLKTVSINPECIEWIEFDSNDIPPTGFMAKTVTIRQLSAGAFKEWVAKNKVALTAAMELEQGKNVLLAYGMATFKSGRLLYMEVRAKIEGVAERIKWAQKVFGMPALFVYGETDGLYLLNTKNIATWQVVPGLKQSGFTAVAGELTGIRKS